MTERFDVVVVGAGPAGLLAAWRCALAGRRVLVVERGRHVGGMAASIDVGGMRVDLGSHRLHKAASPRVLGALRDLIGDDLLERERTGRIALAGRFVAFPLRFGDLVRNLPRSMTASMAWDAITGPVRRPRDDSFAEVIRCGLGPTVLESFYSPYAAKLWGIDARELSAELACRRVSTASQGAVVRRLLSRDGQGKRTFLYPRGGFGQIPEALLRAALDAGAVVELGCAVERIALRSGQARVGLAGGRSVTAPFVLSTIPITVLARLVDTVVPPAVASAIDGLSFRAMRLVYLVLDRPQYTPFDAHYLPSPDTVVSRVSEPKNYRDGDDPPDRTVLCAEVPCAEGDSIWCQPAETLGDRVAAEIESLGLPPVGPSSVEVVGLPDVYPVYRSGFERHLDLLELWLAGSGPVVTLGRAGLFTPDNTHHVLDMAWDAADCLSVGADLDRTRWSAARERFRAHVVED